MAEVTKDKEYCGPKYVVVTGGVISGVGKGLTTASMGRILQQYGYSTTAAYEMQPLEDELEDHYDDGH